MNRDRPWPDAPPGSRFAAVSRRAFLRRSAAAAGLLTIGGLAACGANDDADTFAAGEGDGSAASESTTDTTASASDSASTTADTSESTATTEAPAEDDAIPDGAELVVAFTYAPSATGGRVENPYIAVWIEDADASLVAALAVWYSAGRNARYLSELRRWSSTDGSAEVLDAISSATRTPGDYALVWDGADLDGGRAATGEYFVCIEAAREHGPYSLIRQSVTLGDEPTTTALSSDQELTGASADYRLA